MAAIFWTGGPAGQFAHTARPLRRGAVVDGLVGAERAGAGDLLALLEVMMVRRPAAFASCSPKSETPPVTKIRQ